MSSITIEQVEFTFYDMTMSTEAYPVVVSCYDPCEEIVNTDLLFTLQKPIDDKTNNIDLIRIQGINNILLLRSYLNHVIELHDRGLVL